MEVGGSHMDASRRRTFEAAAGVIAGTNLEKSVVAVTNFNKSSLYKVAETHRMPNLYWPFSAKEPCN